MARTYIPPVGALKKRINRQKLLKDAEGMLHFYKADEDKAGDIEDAAFYEGVCWALAWLIEQLTGTNPLDDTSTEFSIQPKKAS